MNALWSVSLISFKEGLRHRILYGTVIFALFVTAFAVLISGLYMRDISKIILDICLSAVDICGLLIPFFLAINLLSGDIEKRTIYSLLARPISRTHYIIGKFVGLSLLTALLMGIVTMATLAAVLAATYIYPAHFFSTVSISTILTCALFSLLGIIVLNSTVMLWCSITTSSFLAFMLTVATYLIGQSIEDLVRFMSVPIEGVDISPFVQKTVMTALYIFPNLARFDLKAQAVYGVGPNLTELATLTMYAGSYSIAALILAIIVFRRRDLP